jgi:hypothetical protein
MSKCGLSVQMLHNEFAPFSYGLQRRDARYFPDHYAGEAEPVRVGIHKDKNPPDDTFWVRLYATKHATRQTCTIDISPELFERMVHEYLRHDVGKNLRTSLQS